MARVAQHLVGSVSESPVSLVTVFGAFQARDLWIQIVMDISGTLNHRTCRFTPCSPVSSGLASVFAPPSVSATRPLSFFGFPVAPSHAPLTIVLAVVSALSCASIFLARRAGARIGKSPAFRRMPTFLNSISASMVRPLGGPALLPRIVFLEVLVRIVPQTQRRR